MVEPNLYYTRIGCNMLQHTGSTCVNSVCFPSGGCLGIHHLSNTQRNLWQVTQPIKQATKPTWQPFKEGKKNMKKLIINFPSVESISQQLLSFLWTFPASVSGIARCNLWQKQKATVYLLVLGNSCEWSERFQKSKRESKKCVLLQVCVCGGAGFGVSDCSPSKNHTLLVQPICLSTWLEFRIATWACAALRRGAST